MRAAAMLLGLFLMTCAPSGLPRPVPPAPVPAKGYSPPQTVIAPRPAHVPDPTLAPPATQPAPIPTPQPLAGANP
jgi:hypothetical protein